MRKEPRYALRANYEGFLLLDPDNSDSEPEFYGVELTELSRSGMRLRSRRPIPEGRSFSLTCMMNGRSLDLTVSGDIRWTQRDGDATHVGCSLVAPLPDSIFEELAGEMKSDHRTPGQNEFVLPGFVDFSASRTSTVLQNLSDDGFCVSTHRRLPTSARIQYVVRKPERVAVTATVRWRLLIPHDGYLVGCSFVNSKDASRLRTVCESMQPAERHANRLSECEASVMGASSF